MSASEDLNRMGWAVARGMDVPPWLIGIGHRPRFHRLDRFRFVRRLRYRKRSFLTSDGAEPVLEPDG